MIVQLFSQICHRFADRGEIGSLGVILHNDPRPRTGWLYKVSRFTDKVMQHIDGLGQIIHVAICRDDGTPMWDQPIFVEQRGGITVVMNDKGEVGMIEVERPVIRSVEGFDYMDFDPTALGRPSWEFPRGFPKKGETTEQTAAREAGEELGSPIKEIVKLGEVSANTTYFPIPQPVYLAMLDDSFTGTIPPDINEKILQVSWKSEEQFSQMVRDGQIVCGLTLAAWAMLMNSAVFADDEEDPT